MGCEKEYNYLPILSILSSLQLFAYCFLQECSMEHLERIDEKHYKSVSSYILLLEKKVSFLKMMLTYKNLRQIFSSSLKYHF